MKNRMLPGTKYIIICGYSFAGKTTLGNAICEIFPYVQIDVDEIKEKLYGKTVKDDELNKEQWTDIYNEADKKIQKKLYSGKSALDSSRYFRKAERIKAISIAEKCGAEMITIFVNTPVGIVKERWQKNRIRQTRRNVSDEGFNEIISVMESPNPDEKAIVFYHADDMNMWLKHHSEKLKI